MKKTQMGSLVLFAFVFGLMGGLMANYLFTGDVAFAEKSVYEVIQAKEIHLVGSDGMLLVKIAKGEDGRHGEITIYGKDQAPLLIKPRNVEEFRIPIGEEN